MQHTTPSGSSERVGHYDSSARGNGSHKSILIGIVVAIAVGIAVGGWLPDLAVKFSILGEVFLNSLMMIVVPLVVLSMIVGITGLGDIRKLGSLGWRTILYYMATTGVSVLIGIILVNIVQPGREVSHGESHEHYAYTLSGEGNRTVTLADMQWSKVRYDDKYILVLLDQDVCGVIESVSENSASVVFWQHIEAEDVFSVISEDGTRLPLRSVEGKLVFAEPQLRPSGTGVEIDLAIAQTVRGKEKGEVSSTLREVLVGNKATGKEGMIPRNIFNAMVRMDILPLIVFALLIGAALSVLGERGRAAVDVISILNDAVMRLVGWIMVVAPVGIFGLIAGRIGEAGGFGGFLPELYALGKYSVTVAMGLALHGFIVLPLILWAIGRRNPFRYATGVAPALLNALSTASSSATLPLTMEGVEKENRVSNRTASFVLPLGATINMDGTALYEAVAAMFIAQVYGIHMGPVEQAIIFLTATLAAIGAAGIPEAGLVTMVIVLRAVGLPVEGIGLILTIDWLLDRFRTTVNVWGDSVGAGVIETLEMKPGRRVSGSTK
ncbi:MAG: dicarboxylate/amino acid:cation symporter [Candidatus Eiseniibacteriota bacterium]|nr:MAG: dicarboxylate/amino acid:cation symporter [Candidatus Eisenbacteria bacterium]